MTALTYETDDDYEVWVNRHLPTMTSSHHGSWVTTRNVAMRRPQITPYIQHLYDERLADCEAKCAMWPKRRTEFRNQAKAEILELARTHKDLAGKWIIFPFRERVDEIWKEVSMAVLKDELGPSAKVATTAPNNPAHIYPICVYVNSWADRDDVKRVLRRLQEMGIVKRTKHDKDLKRMVASFKPDVFTRLGVYHRGGSSLCKIDPVLYRIEDFQNEV
jgi:hypothetical protein